MRDERIVEVLSEQNFWFRDIDVGIARELTLPAKMKLKEEKLEA